MRWSRKAVVKLRATQERVALEDPIAADRLATRLISAGEHLKQFPHLGRPGRRMTRELVVSGTPFTLIYRLDDKGVMVVALDHHAQRRT